jgi:DNA-binding beta-propeller fold protein YncE
LALALALVLVALGVQLLPAVAAEAEAPPELFWEVPEDRIAGAEAGRLVNPRGVAADSATGSVYVADLENARINEFTAWGEFVQAWGWGVDDGSPELQKCTLASGCQQGLEGDGAGQLLRPLGIAVDSAGAVYVFERLNQRVTKYSPDGDFLLMFGGEVNKTTGANVCTSADVKAGDECGAGVEGTASGFFHNLGVGNFIAASPSGSILVGDKDRIQEFDANGIFKSEIPFQGELEALDEDSVFGLAVDPVSEDLYVSIGIEAYTLYRVSSDGTLKGEVKDTVQVGGEPKTFPVAPAGLAVDADGNLFVVDHRQTFGFDGPFEVLKFDPAGDCLICAVGFAKPDSLLIAGTKLMGLATSNACGIPGSDLYVTEFKGGESLAYLDAYGLAPQDTETCPPPKVAPSIEDQYATAVGTEDAVVRAQINPQFWTDTTYYVQYGTDACFESNWKVGCDLQPASPLVLTSKVTNSSIPTQPIELDGLQPDTSYHYRFVANSTGGGPVAGIGGTGSEVGESSTFRTFPEALPAKTNCVNQEVRLGGSVGLPDCRGYEMVSPIDKNGGDIETAKSIKAFPAALDVSSADGNMMTYSSSTAFADAISAPYASQYRAVRNPLTGWQTHALSPPRQGHFLAHGALAELDLQFKLFSSDLDQAWLMHEVEPPLDDCAVPGFINLYRRDNSEDTYEALTTIAPPTKEPDEYFPEVQGASSDGVRTFFRANDRLTSDAAAIDGFQIYEHVSEPGECGEIHLVSVLPDGTASNSASSVGTAAAGTDGFTFTEGREQLVTNAVSSDGLKIYWTAAGAGPGKIYLRLNGVETIPVSASSAQFWAAADDGSSAYYLEGENLIQFTLDEEKSTVIAPQVQGLLGASADGARAYFVSKKAIGGEGEEAQPNLYLVDEGAVSFVATLSPTDVSGSSSYSVDSPRLVSRLARASDDGNYLVFTSDAALTGHDSTDAISGLPDTQVYLFEAGTSRLLCVSCNLTGARPTGRVVVGLNNNEVGLAARIPPGKNQFHVPRVLSEDGSRLYFESLEPLVPRDGNGKMDVYQWQRASGQASCIEAGAELFDPHTEGCLSLISSGADPHDATLVDSTADARNVFIKTQASLLPQDPGRIDIYDARIEGGFAAEEDCKNPEGCGQIVIEDLWDPLKPGSLSGGSNPDLSKCKALQAKALKAAAKTAKLRSKVRRVGGAKAKRLKKQASRQQKKARRLAARARACYATGGS